MLFGNLDTVDLEHFEEQDLGSSYSWSLVILWGVKTKVFPLNSLILKFSLCPSLVLELITCTLFATSSYDNFTFLCWSDFKLYAK